MIDLEIYAKKRPVIDEVLQTSLGLKFIKQEEEREIFRRFEEPILVHGISGLVTPWITVSANKDPYVYSVRPDGIKQELDELRRQGLFVPSALLNKVVKDQGLAADKEMYQILEVNPGFEEKLPHLEPVWGVTRFTEGEPSYKINLETLYYSPRETVSEMLFIGLMLANRFEGLIYDPQTGSLGTPRLKELYDLTSKGSAGVLDQLSKYFDFNAPQ